MKSARLHNVQYTFIWSIWCLRTYNRMAYVSLSFISVQLKRAVLAIIESYACLFYLRLRGWHQNWKAAICMWSICVSEHSISITRCPKDRLIIHLSVQHCFLLLSRPLLSFCCHDNCFFDMYVMWCIWCLGTICLKGLVFISVLLFWLNIVES